MRVPSGPFWILCGGLFLASFFLFFWTSLWQWQQEAYFKISDGYRSQSHFPSQFSDLENPLGLNLREARLADRVRGMQDENQILRHQLSVSQNQLMTLLSDTDSSSNQRKKIKGQFQRQLKQQDKPCDNKESGVPKCEVLEICVVCAGFNSSRIVVTLIKSILFYRRHPIHFHFVVDKTSKNILETLFKSWLVPKAVANISRFF